MSERTRDTSTSSSTAVTPLLADRKQRQRFWMTGFHPLAWLRCVRFHGDPSFEAWEDGRLIRRECGRCQRPVYLAQRECCTPEDPCGPNDPDGICRECASYADPEDIR